MGMIAEELAQALDINVERVNKALENLRAKGLVVDVYEDDTPAPDGLEVWRWAGYLGVTILAAETELRAMEILGLSASEFNCRWSKTSQEHDLKIAKASPETVFRATIIGLDGYFEYEVLESPVGKKEGCSDDEEKE